MISNDQGTGTFAKCHPYNVGDVIRMGGYPRRGTYRDADGRKMTPFDPHGGPLVRIIAVYSNGWDTKLVTRRERIWARLTGRKLA